MLGDKEMNAKEFTLGLSDICNDRDPTRQRTPREVRTLFAFRYYDSSGEGLLQQDEFR